MYVHAIMCLLNHFLPCIFPLSVLTFPSVFYYYYYYQDKCERRIHRIRARLGLIITAKTHYHDMIVLRWQTCILDFLNIVPVLCHLSYCWTMYQSNPIYSGLQKLSLKHIDFLPRCYLILSSLYQILYFYICWHECKCLFREKNEDCELF